MNENGSLTEVITAYLQAVDAGQTPNQDEILARHPELTDELRRFFATQERVREMTEPLRPETPSVAGRFGDYEILGEIGRGGMGVVYRARQVSLGRVVALKMLVGAKGEQQAERLQQESRLLAELEHPNIVPVYDVGQHEGRAFFAMKEIVGSNLEEALPALRQDVREGVRILAVVARAVHFAHQKGVLHRDLKPANVLLDEQGMPYVTDFGLARRLESTPALTQTGALVGTPGYMAPEQATGDRALTAAVDVWALGVMLYRLLTGETPFRGDTPLETLHRIVGGRMRPLGKVAPGVDRSLQSICLHCLRGNSIDRYQRAVEVADDLERWLKGKRVLVGGPMKRLCSRGKRLTLRAFRSIWLRLWLPVLGVFVGVVVLINHETTRQSRIKSHLSMMRKVELALNRGQFDLAHELFDPQQEWPLAEVEDPVRGRRERVKWLLEMDRGQFELAHELFHDTHEWPLAGTEDSAQERWEGAKRLLESHLFSLDENTFADYLFWQFNGHLLEVRQGYHERDGWTGKVLRSFASGFDWAATQPFRRPDGFWSGRETDWIRERVNYENPVTFSPDGSLVLVRIIPEIGGSQAAMTELLREENQADYVAFRKSLPEYFLDRDNLRDFLLVEKDKTKKPLRLFVLPYYLGRVSWSPDGRYVTFCSSIDPASSSPRRVTYDLVDRCWVRIVDSRPGVWKPPAAPDKTRISFPPDQSGCKDLGELEALAYFRSSKSGDGLRVGLSPDGTRAWLQSPGQGRIHVWRMPGVAR